MAKAKSQAKAGVYGLKFGHEGEFRRTVEIREGEKVQLVFRPQVPYTLSEQELAGLQKEIKAGILVEWEEDAKGRQARPGAAPEGVKPQSARVETPPADEPAPSAEEVKRGPVDVGASAATSEKAAKEVAKAADRARAAKRASAKDEPAKRSAVRGARRSAKK